MKTLSTRALVARTNTHQRAAGETLRKALGAALRADVGDYYVVDDRSGFLIDRDVDLERLERANGVLTTDERVAA